MGLNFYKVEKVVKVELKLLLEIYENGAVLTNFILTETETETSVILLIKSALSQTR